MNTNFFNNTIHLVKQLKKYGFYLSESEVLTNLNNLDKLSFYLYDKQCNPVGKRVSILDENRWHEVLDIKDKYEPCDKVAYL